MSVDRVFALISEHVKELILNQPELSRVLQALTDALPSLRDADVVIGVARCVLLLDISSPFARLSMRALYRLAAAGVHDTALASGALPLLRAVLRGSTDPDCVVHAAAILKHLVATGETHRSGLLSLCPELLRALRRATAAALADTAASREPWCAALAECGVVLRALCDARGPLPEPMAAAAPAACLAMGAAVGHKGATAAMARLLSKLSLDAAARTAIAEDARAVLSPVVAAAAAARDMTVRASLILCPTLFVWCLSPQGVVLRLAYALSNLTYTNVTCREALVQLGAPEVLVALFKEHYARLLSDSTARTPQQEHELVDTLAKLARAIANVSASRETVTALSEAQGLTVLVDVVAGVPLDAQGAMEELLLAAAFALSNALCDGEGLRSGLSPLSDHLQRIAAGTSVTTCSRAVSSSWLTRWLAVLVRLLLHGNPEVVSVAASGLSSVAAVQPLGIAALCRSRGDEALCLLLDHSDWAVVAAACGALCNVTASSTHRHNVQRCGGVELLLSTCEAAACAGEWVPATLACRALYNFGYEALARISRAPADCGMVCVCCRLNNSETFFTLQQQDSAHQLCDTLQAVVVEALSPRRCSCRCRCGRC